MKWYSYLLCFILILSGVFCSIGLVHEFNVESGVYGTFESVETINKYNDVLKVDKGVIPFETENYKDYTAVVTEEYTYFDGKYNDYAVMFNGNLLSDVQIYAGKITASINLNFYDNYGEKITTSVVNILIEFFDSNTKITFTTQNIDNSYAYLNQYMNVNGSVLKVVMRGIYE